MAPGTAPAGASSASHPDQAGAHHATDQVPGRAAPSPLHAVPGSHARHQRSRRPPAPTPRPLPPPATPEPLGRPPHHPPPQVLAPRRTAPAARSAVRLSSSPPGTNTMITPALGHYRKSSHVIVSNRCLHPPRSSATHETAGTDGPSRSSAVTGAKFPGSRRPGKTLRCEPAWPPPGAAPTAGAPAPNAASPPPRTPPPATSAAAGAASWALPPSCCSLTLLIVRNQRILQAWNARQEENQRRAAKGLPPKTRRRRRRTLASLATGPP